MGEPDRRRAAEELALFLSDGFERGQIARRRVAHREALDRAVDRRYAVLALGPGFGSEAGNGLLPARLGAEYLANRFANSVPSIHHARLSLIARFELLERCKGIRALAITRDRQLGERNDFSIKYIGFFHRGGLGCMAPSAPRNLAASLMAIATNRVGFRRDNSVADSGAVKKAQGIARAGEDLVTAEPERLSVS